MKLVIITALFAVCGAAKLDRSYLPPSSAAAAGGSAGSLQTPLTRTSEQGLETPNLPIGSYSNNFEGVVIDAAAPGTRTAEPDLSNLGGPRQSYGSTNSKVGEAAFRGSAGFRSPPFGGQSNGQLVASSNSEINTQNSQVANGFNANTQFSNEATSHSIENKSERPQAAKDRNSNILALSNDVNTDRYSYGFETDNGITVGENGVALNGIQAEGGYSYQGDDGQVYKVTYVADKDGYRPQGAHLPTPPPIPEEILKSIEQNAKEEAAGIMDDGSYDAQKYNAEGDYTNDNSGNNRHNGGQLPLSGKRPGSDATASDTFINQSGQGFRKPVFGQEISNQQNTGYNGQFLQSTGASGNFENTAPQNDQSDANGQSFSGNSASLQLNSLSISGAQSSQSNDVSGRVGFAGSQINSQTLNQQNLGQNQITQTFGQRNQMILANNGASSGQSMNGQFGNRQNFRQPSRNQLGSASTEGQSAFGNQNQFGFQATASAQAQNVATESESSNQQNFNGQLSSQSFKPSFSQNYDNSQSQPQSEGSVGQTQFSSNQFNFKNQYLPPNAIQRQPIQQGINRFVSNSQQIGNKQNVNINAFNRQTPSFASASASTSGQMSPQFSQSQPLKSQNNFNYQQNTSPTKPNQNYMQQKNYNTKFNNNFLQHSGSSQSEQEQPSSGPKPTSIPSIELTTPLEPNETSAESQSSQGSQGPSHTTASFGSIVSKPVGNTQPQALFGFQGNFASEQQSSQTFSANPTSSPELSLTTPQVVNKQPINSFAKPQSPRNSFSQNVASFSQNNDDSYYYNQPAKPFGQSNRPEAPRFPSAPSYQSNGMSSQNNFKNQNSFSGNQRLPTSQSNAPLSPIASSQFSQQQHYNGVTQAAISSFPSPSSVSNKLSNQFASKQTFNQQPFGNIQASKPMFNQQTTLNNQFQSTSGPESEPALSQVNNSRFPSQPSQFSQMTATFGFQTQNKFEQTKQSQNNPTSTEQPDEEQKIIQQYEGTIYEYNKPAQVLSASSQSDSSSSQTIDSGTAARPSFNQINNQFSSQDNQSPTGFKDIRDKKPFGAGSVSQFSQNGQNQVANQFNQNNNVFGSTPVSDKKPSHQVTSSVLQQNVEGSQGTKPYSINGQFSTNQNIFNPNQQPMESALTSQPSRGSQSQFGFSNSGNTPAAENNGYFYPNPANKFSENSPSINSQSNVNVQNKFVQPQLNQFGNPTSQFAQNSAFGQRVSNSPNQPIRQSSAFSQALASGQASASASASTPQQSQYKPFGTQNRNQFALTQSQQNSQQFDSKNVQPIENSEDGDDLKPYGALSSKQNPTAERPKPIFNSACCHNSKDSSPAQSSDSPQSFEGSQSFNAQSFAGKGEQFGGPREPPKFDETGYHY